MWDLQHCVARKKEMKIGKRLHTFKNDIYHDDVVYVE